jgi:hypothetical protein
VSDPPPRRRHSRVGRTPAAIAVGVLLALAIPTVVAAQTDSITGTNIVATVGAQFSGMIATSTLPVGEVSVDWGDGIVTTGSIAAGGSISGTHTYTAEGDFGITLTTGTVVGHSTAVVLTPSQGAVLVGSDATTVPDGGAGTASVLPPGPGLTATLQRPTGPATLFVAVYGANPESDPVTAGGFYDVRVVGGGPTATLVVVFHYRGVSGSARLMFFDAATGRYVPVQSPSIITDQGAQTITVTLDAATVPSIAQLAGTVFAAVAPTPAAAPIVTAPRFTG